ncbi:MAG: acylphosphatase [Elusimicrobia bacterium]|nr:acylphosphatase [Elusimicrobiota bacterium]
MRVFFKISGLVQGIGYRWFVRDTAAKHRVTGWVGNFRDGTVEGQAQGDKKALDGFLLELKNSHPRAEVTGTAIRELEDIKGETGFTIEFSELR